MEMVLLDWTRMGRGYCLAGAIVEKGSPRVVRPLPARSRGADVRNVGWSPYLLDGHTRWEVFELIGPEPAAPQPPHVEDVWVRSLRPLRRLALESQRREILDLTTAKPGEPLFGAPLLANRSAAYLEPGTGKRSLATLIVPSAQIRFSASRRAGCPEPDFRVALPLPPLEDRSLPVKDHHLLCRAETAMTELKGQIGAMNEAVRQMGELVAVRLGLSRGFASGAAQAANFCWLMADGFFSFSDPQS